MALDAAGELAHAMLFSGPPGIGKNQFVEELVQTLLCSVAGGKSGSGACGECRSCIQHLAGNHPDCLVLSPEPETRQAFLQYPGQQCQEGRGTERKTPRRAITVQQVREMSDWLSTSTHYGGHKVVVITPADSLNENAANALLKMLEEPPANTLFFLVTAQPGRLLPTVISRCRLIENRLPQPESAKRWLFEHVGAHDGALLALELARGAPLLARQFLADETIDQWEEVTGTLDALLQGGKDPLLVAEGWEKRRFEPLLELLLLWFNALIRCAGCNVISFSADSSGSRLCNQAQRVNLKTLFRLLDRLVMMSRHREIALNRRMQWEDFLVDWSTAGT